MLVSKLTPNLEFKGILKDDESLSERISKDSGKYAKNVSCPVKNEKC